MTLNKKFVYRTRRKRKPLPPFIRGFIWGGTLTLTAMISGLLGMTAALKSSFSVNFNPLLEQIQAIKKSGFSSLFIPTL